jgi:hypothetical protein
VLVTTPGTGDPPDHRAATKLADRLDALAETAELMGDEAAAARLHDSAWRVRLVAMDELDTRERRI